MEKDYNGVSLLIRNYFKLQCGVYGPHMHQSYSEERGEDARGFPVFRLTIKSPQADHILQRIFSEAQGFE